MGVSLEQPRKLPGRRDTFFLMMKRSFRQKAGKERRDGGGGWGTGGGFFLSPNNTVEFPLSHPWGPSDSASSALLSITADSMGHVPNPDLRDIHICPKGHRWGHTEESGSQGHTLGVPILACLTTFPRRHRLEETGLTPSRVSQPPKGRPLHTSPYITHSTRLLCINKWGTGGHKSWGCQCPRDQLFLWPRTSTFYNPLISPSNKV